MHFDCNIYFGSIVKGNLRSAIAYIKQFPEKCDLYNRFVSVFEHEQYISYDVDAELNEILLSYQQYYRDIILPLYSQGAGRKQTKRAIGKAVGHRR